MATYYIVAENTTPLGPNEIEAGSTITPSAGDVFIVTAGADKTTTFDSGSSVSFDIQFNASNANGFTVEAKGATNPNVTIADGVELPNLFLKAEQAESINLTIGDNVILDNFHGSDGDDTVTIGDNFTTNQDFDLRDGNDAITIGENADFSGRKVEGGNGDDTVTSSTDGLDLQNFETELFSDGVVDGTSGDDSMGAGHADVETDKIDGEDGNDDTIIGYYGNDTIEGGAGNDVIHGDYDGGYTPPPGPASGAEQLSYVVKNSDLNNGQAKVEVDQFSSDVSLANDVTITDNTTGTLTELSVEKFGGGDNQADVIRIDLTTFDDNFLLSLNNSDVGDKIFLIGVETSADNGDGTFTYTYVGSDDAEHSVTVDPQDATIEIYRAELDATQSSDVIDGGAGDDTIYGGFGDDSLTGGSGADSIEGGVGNDTLVGGTEDDVLVGGSGDDLLQGGDGADTLAGDGDDASSGAERVAFEWSGVPDPSDGGQIDNNDTLVGTGVQSVGGVDVTHNITGSVSYAPGGEDGAGNVYTGGIDAGTGSVDGFSAASLDSSMTMNLAFSTDVENVQFNINDVEVSGSTITVYAFDAGGNPIPVSITGGASVAGSDNDAVAGDETWVGNGGGGGDDDGLGSVQVTVPGPVASIDISFTSAGGDSATMTDVWFDQPNSATIDAGDDSIDAGDGDDVIIASGGTDTIAGGTGSDTYDASAGAKPLEDSITVTVDQAGDATVAKTNNATTDTVTSVETYIADEVDGLDDSITVIENVETGQVSGFDNSAVGTFTPSNGGDPITFGGVGEPTINDLLNGTYDPGSGPIKGSGSYQITSGEENGATLGNISFSNFEQIAFSVVCYGPGVLIDTPSGPLAVEALRPGDLVDTLDAGPQPVRWVRAKDHPLEEAVDDDYPVLISAGALGPGRPRRDLVVSPQHRILVGGHGQLDTVFDKECFVPAKALTGQPKVRHMRGKRTITWTHFALDRHHVVVANGLMSESLYLGPMVVNGLTPKELAELEAIFGPLPADGSAMNGAAARPFLPVGKTRRRLRVAKNAAVDAMIAPPSRALPRFGATSL